MGRSFCGQRSVLVTGASSGIGAALARRFADDGARVAIVARRRERLEELAEEIAAAGHPRPVVICADLVEDGAVGRVVAEAREGLGQIDVLVNNAGVGYAGAFAEHSADDVERMLRLNIQALVELTHLVLPEMLERRRGWIMNVASAAAYQPMAYMSAYAATKSFVLSFSEGLWAEVRKRGVTVTCLNPGTTRTEFFDHHDWDGSREVLMKRAMSAEKVADIGVKALAKGKPNVTCGWSNRMLVGLGALLPRSWVARLTAKMLKPGR